MSHFSDEFVAARAAARAHAETLGDINGEASWPRPSGSWDSGTGEPISSGFVFRFHRADKTLIATVEVDENGQVV